jgi:DNA polymerase-1
MVRKRGKARTVDTRSFGVPVTFSDTTVTFDLESHSVTERFDLPPEEFVRLIQWSYGEQEEVHTTTDLEEFRAVLRAAKLVVGANIHAFDLPCIFGQDSPEPLRMARERRVFDTMIHATVGFPAPFDPYMNSKGRMMVCDSPPQFRKYYSLGNLAHQLKVEGKLLDLTDLADKYGHVWEPVYSEKTGRRLKHDRKVALPGGCCTFSAIPVDDPDFVAYAKMDVVAARNVAKALLEIYGWTPYAQFEQVKAAIAAQIGRNGIKLDSGLAQTKVRDQLEEAGWVLNRLRDEFGFPVSGKKPLATKSGKEALERALISTGVKIKDLAKTATGTPSFGGDSVAGAAAKAGTPEATALADAVSTLAGQRSLPQLALASVHKDGFAHPSILPLQRSARFSTTDPGLTIWDPRHKDLYISDSEDDLLVEFDYSNADARAVAAMSGDREFAKRFLPGADGHMINAHLLWGADVVGGDKHDPVTAEYRQSAKAPGHGIGYGMGARKMAQTTGLSLEECTAFVRNYKAAYPGVVAWQKRSVDFARKNGYVVSDWGRRLPVEPGREQTQATGLLGQTSTHELLLEGCVRLPDRLLRRLKLTIHDAVLMSLAKATLDRDIALVIECFTRTWHPKGGQAIHFPLSHGEPGRTWAQAAH